MEKEWLWMNIKNVQSICENCTTHFGARILKKPQNIFNEIFWLKIRETARHMHFVCCVQSSIIFLWVSNTKRIEKNKIFFRYIIMFSSSY